MSEYLLTNEIIFDSKPDAVPYNYRISYKMAQLCLILFKSCSSKAGCSLVKLHIISNALNTKKYMKALEDYVNEKMGFMLVRFDPAVNRALKYAIADNLIIQLKNGTFKLSGNGKDFSRGRHRGRNPAHRQQGYSRLHRLRRLCEERFLRL